MFKRITDEEFTEYEVRFCKDKGIQFPARGAFRDECNRDARLAAYSGRTC